MLVKNNPLLSLNLYLWNISPNTYFRERERKKENKARIIVCINKLKRKLFHKIKTSEDKLSQNELKRKKVWHQFEKDLSIISELKLVY